MHKDTYSCILITPKIVVVFFPRNSWGKVYEALLITVGDLILMGRYILPIIPFSVEVFNNRDCNCLENTCLYKCQIVVDNRMEIAAIISVNISS